ncbi:hypothetical protein V8G54_034701 [Vigna mungo]|uniref:Uncharacterized protein n=1 Tax=Vigna mungo TaxID=3915 RepID=A0AAQ3RDR4_VIGMU
MTLSPNNCFGSFAAPSSTLDATSVVDGSGSLPCTCKNTLNSSLFLITGCAANRRRYFSSATLRCSTNSCFCITWLSTTLLSGRGGIKNPRYASANRSERVTTSRNLRRTPNSAPEAPNSGMFVIVVIK